MRIRPQSELTGIQNRTVALNQAEAAAQSRFDTALLQAAQGVKDSESDAFAGLSPKMQQALSAGLEELSGKSLAELKDLARQPQALAALVSGLSQGESLSTAETARLSKLLLMALPRLVEAKTKEEPSAGASASGARNAAGRAQSGPSAPAQGSDFFSILSGRQAAPGPEAPPQAPENANAGAGSLAAAGGTPAGSDNGVAGVQSGQVYAGGYGQAQVQAGVHAGENSAPVQGFALPVALNVGQVQNLFSNRPALGATASSGPAPATALGGADNNTAVQPGSPAPSAPSQGAGAGAAQGEAPAQASSANGPGNGASQGVQADGAARTAGSDVDLGDWGMDVQVADATLPLPVEEGSQVTLKGDGTWVYPESAPFQAPKAQPQAQAQVQPVAPQVSANPTAGSAPAAPELGLPVFGRTLASTPLDGSAAENGAATGGDAVRTTATAPAVDEEALLAEDGSGDPADPSSGVRPQGSDSVFQGAGPGAGQGSGAASQPQAGSLLQASAVAPTQAQPAFTDGTTRNSGEEAPGQGAPKGPVLGQAGQAQAQAAQAPGQSQGFGAALAAVNQSASQGGSQGAWPQGAPVTAGIAQAIHQAINDAGASAPGRLTIQLSPANLGSVQAELSMSDGKLTARLVTSQQDVRDALARDLSGFKAGLESHGVVVNEVSVALRANVDNGQGGPRQEAPGNPWRTLNPIQRGAAGSGVPAGSAAYGEAAAGGRQGFSALA